MSCVTVACRVMLLGVPPPPQNANVVRFVEVRRDAAPRRDRRHGGGRSAAGGLALVDLDGDGALELFVGRGGGLPDRLLRFRDGALVDEAANLGLDRLDATLGARFLDFDGDGTLEALLFGEGLELLRRTNGRFEPAAGGLALPAGFEGVCTAVAVADVDRDGDLDLFVATHTCAPGDRERAAPFPLLDASDGPRDLFFRNEGGRFRECLEEVGLAPGSTRRSSDAAFADLDGDGAPDLLVANEFGASLGFRNDGHGRFRAMPLLASGAIVGATRFLARGDLDGDGRDDLFFAAASDPAGVQLLAQEPAWLERLSPRTREDLATTVRGGFALVGAAAPDAQGGERRDASVELGLARLGPFRGGLLADLAGDAALELLLLDVVGEPGPAERRFLELVPELAREGIDPQTVAEAFAEPVAPHSPRAARLLARGSDGRYADSPIDLGELRGGARAIAWDFDGDGDADLAVTGDRGPELRVLRAMTNGEEPTPVSSGSVDPASAKLDRPPALDLLVVAPRVPAPALELVPVAGAKIVLSSRRARPAVLVVDRGDGSTLVARARELAARAREGGGGGVSPPFDLVLLDAAASDAKSKEAIAALGALLDHLLDEDAASAALRVDAEGFVDLLAWDGTPEAIASAAATPSAGRWLAAPDGRPAELAARYLAAELPQHALQFLEQQERAGARGLDFAFGTTLVKLKQWAAAAERLARVPLESSDLPAAQLELGRCRLRLQQPHEARRAFELVIARRPADARARFELGRLLLSIAPDRESANVGTEQLRVATYLEPDWADAQIWFGQGLARVGRRDEAELALTRAAELEPKNGQPPFELAKLCLADGRLDEALRHAEKSAELTPGNPTTKTLIDSIRARQAAAETK